MTMDRRWRRKLSWRLLALQSCWSFERMQGLGLLLVLEPWLKRCWGGAAAGREALRRHDGCFNTQPFMAPLVVGMVCALEEDAARAQGDDRQAKLKRLGALKTAAAQALAGIGDALFWSALRPFCAAVAVLAMLAAAPLVGATPAIVVMVAAYLAVYDAPTLAWRWSSLSRGYDWKDQLALKLKEIPWQTVIRRLRYAGTALAVAATVLALIEGASPIGKAPGALATAIYLLAYRLRAATATRLYAATCAAGVVAAAAGWV